MPHSVAWVNAIPAVERSAVVEAPEVSAISRMVTVLRGSWNFGPVVRLAGIGGGPFLRCGAYDYSHRPSALVARPLFRSSAAGVRGIIADLVDVSV